MAVRIFAAGLVAASLLVAPAFAAQTTSSTTTTAAKPAHTETTTTTTDRAVSDTDASGKTVTKHHKVAKHRHKASKAMAPAATDTGAGNTMQ